MAQTRQTKHRTNRTENQHERATKDATKRILAILPPKFRACADLFSSADSSAFSRLLRHSGKMTAHASNRLRDFRARRNGRHRNKLRQNGGNLEIPANVLFLPRLSYYAEDSFSESFSFTYPL